MQLSIKPSVVPTLAAVFFTLAGAVQAKEPVVEIGSLVKQTLEQQKDGVLDWSFLSRQNSPVVWLTDGIDFKDYTRKGIVVAAVDGFIPEVLQKTVAARPWGVTLSGSKYGVTTVRFSNDGCFGTTALSPECASKIAKVPESLALSNVTMNKVCEFGPGAAHSEVYRISLESESPAYMHLQTGGGSGGMFIDVAVILKLPTASDVPVLSHDSAVCGLLFAKNNGPDGFPAWDYRQRIK